MMLGLIILRITC